MSEMCQTNFRGHQNDIKQQIGPIISPSLVFDSVSCSYIKQVV